MTHVCSTCHIVIEKSKTHHCWGYGWWSFSRSVCLFSFVFLLPLQLRKTHTHTHLLFTASCKFPIQCICTGWKYPYLISRRFSKVVACVTQYLQSTMALISAIRSYTVSTDRCYEMSDFGKELLSTDFSLASFECTAETSKKFSWAKRKETKQKTLR